MKKSEVYSWRVDPALKEALEAEAHAAKSSVAKVIEKACRAHIKKSPAALSDEKEQARLRKALFKVAGTVNGPGVSATNKIVRETFQLKRLEDELRRRAPPSR